MILNTGAGFVDVAVCGFVDAAVSEHALNLIAITIVIPGEPPTPQICLNNAEAEALAHMILATVKHGTR